MAKPDYFADAILAWLKGTTFPAAPATVYVALLLTLPTLSTAGTEVSGGSYARRSVTTSTGWTTIATVDGKRQIANAADLTFVTATADWATGAAPIVGWAIRDASTAGNRLRYGAFATPKTVLNGQVAKILAGELVLREG